MPQVHLTPIQAAELLGIHVDTLKAASDRGEIPCWRTPGGHRRYYLADIEQLVADRSSSTDEPAEAAS